MRTFSCIKNKIKKNYILTTRPLHLYEHTEMFACLGCTYNCNQIECGPCALQTMTTISLSNFAFTYTLTDVRLFLKWHKDSVAKNPTVYTHSVNTDWASLDLWCITWFWITGMKCQSSTKSPNVVPAFLVSLMKGHSRFSTATESS